MKLLQQKSKFLITGATGFIGKRLVDELLQDGHQIFALTRKKNLKSKNKNLQYINDFVDLEFDFDIIINLAGAPISVNWNAKNRQEIYDSRINITKKIVEKILATKTPPKLFISGSAIGFYGTSETTIFSENSSPTKQNLFSQKLCKDWEFQAQKVGDSTRLVLLRTSVVIGQGGGIIKKLTPPFKMGLGGNIGDGKQIMSWIHLDDAIGIIELIINNSTIKGAINLSSPNSCSNAEFSGVLAKKFNRPYFFHIPKFAVKTIFGQMGEELLLSSQKIAPQKAQENGYDFKFVNIADAIATL